MQPYQHIQVRGNRGALTFGSAKHFQKLLVLGASCVTSATLVDGIVGSFVAVPKHDTEVVAVAVINLEDPKKPEIAEAFLLGITLKGGKAEVDLVVPYGGVPGAVGQMLVKSNSNSCQLRVMMEGEKTRLSAPWAVSSLAPADSSDETAATVPGESFSDLCKVLVEADKSQTVSVELLNADGSSADPASFVEAIAVGPITEVLGELQRQVALPDGEIVCAHWEKPRWVVLHPCN